MGSGHATSSSIGMVNSTALDPESALPCWERCEDDEGEYWWHPEEGMQRSQPEEIRKLQATLAAKEAAEASAAARAAEQGQWELMLREAAYREPGEEDVYWWNEVTSESQQAPPAGLLRRDIAVLGDSRCALGETASAFANACPYHAGDPRVERCECYVGRSDVTHFVIRLCHKPRGINCEPLRSRLPNRLSHHFWTLNTHLSTQPRIS